MWVSSHIVDDAVVKNLRCTRETFNVHSAIDKTTSLSYDNHAQHMGALTEEIGIPAASYERAHSIQKQFLGAYRAELSKSLRQDVSSFYIGCLKLDL